MKMRYNVRKFLASAALATALLSTSALVPSAHAQKAHMLNPSTDWAVTKIGQANSSKAYCALARRFVQNTILTVAKNTSEETSFAIDFQRPKFDTTRNLYVVLDPGSGQQRAYDVRPISSNAFVIRLGKDDAFFAALEETGYLRADVGNQTYHFNLADIKRGHGNLETCVDAMIAQVDKTPEIGAPTPEETKISSSLREQIDALKSEIKKLSTSIKGDVADVASAAAAPVAVAVQQAEVALLDDAAPAELRHEDKVALPEIEEKTVSVVAAKPPAPQEMPPQEALAEPIMVSESRVIKELQQENERLKSSLRAVEGTAGTIEELKAQIEFLKEENASYQGTEEEKVLSLRVKNERLRESLKEAEKAQSLVQELNFQLQNLRAKNVELSQQVISAKDEAEKFYKDKITKIEGENQRLSQALKNNSVEKDLLAHLRDQVFNLEQENMELKGAMDIAQAELQNEKQEVESLKLLLVEKDTSDKALVDLNDQVALMSQEKASLVSRLTAYGQEKEQLAQSLLEAKTENEKLQIALDKQRAEANEHVLKVAAAQKEIEELVTSNKALTNKVVAYESDDTAERLGAQLASLEAKHQETQQAHGAEIRALKLLLADQQNTQASVKSLQVELEQMQDEKTALVGRLATFGEQEKRIQSFLDNALAENQTLKAQLEQKQAVAQNAYVLASQLEQIQQKNQEMQLALNVQEEEKARQGAVIEQAQKLIAQLQNRNAELLHEASAKRAAKASSMIVEVELEELKAENQMLKLDLQQARERLDRIMDGAREASNQTEQHVSELQGEVQRRSVTQTLEAGGILTMEAEVAQTDAESGEKEVLAITEILSNIAPAASPDPEGMKHSRAQKGKSYPRFAQLPDQQNDASNNGYLTDAQRQEMALREEIDGQGNIGAEAAEALEESFYEDIDALQPEDMSSPAVPPPSSFVSESEMIDDVEEKPFLEPVKVGRKKEIDDTAAAVSAPDEKALPAEEYMSAQKAPAIDAAAPKKAPEEPAVTFYEPAISMPQALNDAGFDLRGDVVLLEKASNAGRLIHQWQIGDVYGSSDQKPVPRVEDFENNILSYLDLTQSRCGGDFAITPSGSADVGDMRMDSYEVACIATDISSSAALLFTYKDGSMSVIAHEAAAENLDQAMDIRDRMMHAIAQK